MHALVCLTARGRDLFSRYAARNIVRPLAQPLVMGFSTSRLIVLMAADFSIV
jgi:hypothetical protein